MPCSFGNDSKVTKTGRPSYNAPKLLVAGLCGVKTGIRTLLVADLLSCRTQAINGTDSLTKDFSK
jgi:hypothetical protein